MIWYVHVSGINKQGHTQGGGGSRNSVTPLLVVIDACCCRPSVDRLMRIENPLIQKKIDKGAGYMYFNV